MSVVDGVGDTVLAVEGVVETKLLGGMAAEDEGEEEEMVSPGDEDEGEDEGEEGAVTPEVMKRNVISSVCLVSVYMGGILLLIREATKEETKLGDEELPDTPEREKKESEAAALEGVTTAVVLIVVVPSIVSVVVVVVIVVASTPVFPAPSGIFEATIPVVTVSPSPGTSTAL